MHKRKHDDNIDMEITPEKMFQILVNHANRNLCIRVWKVWDCLHEFLYHAEKQGKLSEANFWLASMLEPTDWPVRRNTFLRVLLPEEWKSPEKFSLIHVLKKSED